MAESTTIGPADRVMAITGRFQPFHMGHLEYLQCARARGGFVYIGITNPDPARRAADPTAPHRHRDGDNPYTFHERLAMIRAACDAAAIDPAGLAIVPFPIGHPELWEHYIPLHATQVVRVFGEWEAAKAARLRMAGYAVVEVPGAHPKPVAGVDIRRRMAEGGSVAELLPPAVAALCRRPAPSPDAPIRP